ncbi:lamin tail domain-containing protein [Intrasporangium sp. YIM S08009]|uniref:lamin tail domain-containing protein n=1 Tax=Intrasporangium zincisolvens TaxID=3080018 RepID=UPI002B05A76E|nr:lamin tail domain-containing protein [Intrasporangium sp. YIM S08009]
MSTRTTAAAAAAGIAIGLLGPITAATEAQALPAVMIYKVQYDSPGTDNRSNTSLNAEYVVLKNTTRSNRVLTGWTLRDKTGYTYRFPAFTLKAGATVTIRTGKGTATATNRYYNLSSYVWNNTGDTAYLRNAAGSLVDTCAWTSTGSGSRYC